MSGAASPLEISWTVIAAAGLLFSVWLMAAGWMDLEAVQQGIRAVPPRARIWGPRWWVALSAVVANASLCLVWLGFILIGLIAMRFPPPPPTTEQAISNMWVGWVLIGMEALLATVQGWQLFVRERVNETARGQT
ncbi:MAG TPA: hypothetical protein VFV93_02440 [Thermomicrobiales bacterium]|nr:hypothetical protein [Thermomicrobiales bacterium]